MQDTAADARWRGPRRAGSILAVAVAALTLSSHGQLSPRPLMAEDARESDEATRLVEEQGQVARQALQMIEKAWSIGAPVNLPTQEYHVWSRRLLGTEIYLGFGQGEAKTEDVEVYLNRAKGKADPRRLAAFGQHTKRMKHLEDRYRPLYERKQLSAFDFATVEYHRLQAQIWEARERDRPGD